MPLHLGNKQEGFALLGTKNLDKAYLGTTLVFQQGFVRTLTGIPPLTTPKATIGKDMINYKIYGNTVQGGLPSEYQRVEYLQSSGTQYIETGIYLDFAKNIEIDTEFVKPTGGSRALIIGSYNSSDVDQQTMSLEVTAANLIRLYAQSKTVRTFDLQSSNAIVIGGTTKLASSYNAGNSTMDLNYVLGGSTYTDSLTDVSMASSGVAYKPLRFFLDYRATTTSIANPIKIGATSISQNGTLYGDFIPCYRKSDNKPGMYDLVTNTFYTNAGTGEFTVGANVYPTPTAPIEIESVGDKTKNLLQNNEASKTTTGITFTVNADGSVTANGTATDNTQFRINIDTSKLHGNYYFCACYSAQSGVDSFTWDLTTNARLKKWNGTTNSASSTNGTLQEIQIPEGHEAVIVLRAQPGTVLNNYTFYPMIVASTETNATWEPYGYQIPVTSGTITSIITLAEPLRRIVAGSLTYTDYSDYASQKVYRQCGVKVFDGTEDWHIYSLGGTNVERFYVRNAVVSATNSACPCSHFRYASTNEDNEHYRFSSGGGGTNNEFLIYISKTIAATEAELKAFLAAQYAAGTPVTIVYPLATATEESVSLPAVPTERGATTTVDVATEVVPSNVEIVYRGK